MLKSHIAKLFSLVLILMLAACAQPGSNAPMEIRSGVIEQITNVSIPSNHDQGLGAIVGGLGGLGIGALIGAGTGKAVAMTVGALGGALTGYEVQKHYEKPIPGQQIFVRTNQGVLVSITQPAGNFVKGQRVYIEGTGIDARVVAQ